MYSSHTSQARRVERLIRIPDPSNINRIAKVRTSRDASSSANTIEKEYPRERPTKVSRMAPPRMIKKESAPNIGSMKK